MALIKCTECGKEFSDKAAACPNCGCPVSEVIKGNISPEEQKKAAEQILAAVERALDRARKAGARFELESVYTKELAKELDCNPNWKYGKDNIRIIVSDAVRTCDALYSTYQGLIPKLDAECRPLLQKNPGPVAVRFVLGTIKWLNDESEIENNYAAHYEDIDLGTLVRAKYLPSEANKMIQAIWQAEYLKSPDQDADKKWSQKLSDHKRLAADLERTTKRTKEYPDLAERRAEEKEELKERRKAEKARLKAEENQRKAEENKRKAEEDRKRAEAEKRRPQLEADKQKYEDELKKWESECESVKVKRSDRVNEMIAAEKISLAASAEERRDKSIAAANEKIESEKKRKQEAEAKLASLGALKFSEKKTQKRIIEDAARLIAEAQAAIPYAQETYSWEMNSVENRANDKADYFRQRAERELLLPAKPSKPQSLVQEEERIKREEEKERERRRKEKRRETINKIRAKYLSKEHLSSIEEGHMEMKEAIVELLFDNPKPMTVSDMKEELGYKQENTGFNAMLYQLAQEGIIEKYTEKRRSYFRIPE